VKIAEVQNGYPTKNYLAAKQSKQKTSMFRLFQAPQMLQRSRSLHLMIQYIWNQIASMQSSSVLIHQTTKFGLLS
ncbi:MAG: hypothetical protein EBQ89_00595, partial [Alphaproteobacteria bacterium]|nr:hypothetical protein [Alphaproteobacteria bacterium]